MPNECAIKLRIGESNRDASDKIRGFLYQDLIAINTILSFDDAYNYYIEWVEDILIENDDEVRLIQVKYYPKSEVKFQEIFSDMYYQFLKFQLIDSQKIMKTYCYHHSTTIYDKKECKDVMIGQIVENNCTNKTQIIEELKKCSNMEERKKLLFNKVSSTQLLDKLNFESEQKSSIKKLKEEVSQQLLDLFKSNPIIKRLSEEDAKKILISLSIDFIQQKYYSKLEDHEKRKIKKQDLIICITSALSYDVIKGISLIKSIVFNCIDNIFVKVIEDKKFYGDDIIEKYQEIYIASKEYFNKNLDEKQTRFAFLNTLSNCNEKIFNYEKYKDYNVETEKEHFFKNEERMEAYIERLWKLIYNIETDYNNVKLEKYILCGDCLLFNCKVKEKNSPVLLGSFIQEGKMIEQANNIFSRIKKMRDKPQKWYLSGMKKGKYLYSYEIIKTVSDENDITKGFDNDIEYFKVECLKCLKFDTCQMHINDNLEQNLFLPNCKEEV